MSEAVDRWRDCFRRGFAPQMADCELDALEFALELDDDRLKQGCTTEPPPFEAIRDWKTEGACLVGYAWWQGPAGGKATVGEVEEMFARRCAEADGLLDEVAGCRHLLNWWDYHPDRFVARADMLAEVQRERRRRRETPPAPLAPPPATCESADTREETPAPP